MSSFVHHEQVVVPRSTIIKEDLLCSVDMITKLNHSLAQGMIGREISKVYTGLDLEKLIHVYNENVEYINYRCQEFKFFDQYFPTFQAYQASSPTVYPATAQDNYDHIKTIEERKYFANLEEVDQLAQAGFLHLDLKKKIEKVIQCIVAVKFYPAEAFPQLATPSEGALRRIADSDFSHHRAELRCPTFESKVKEFILKDSRNSTTTSSASATTTSSVPSTPGQAVPVETSQPQPVAAVAVMLDFTPKNGVLGICHEPSWGELPVLFTQLAFSSSKSWNGHIPVDKEFKFVIVDNGTVTQWEQGPNRRLTAEDPLSSLSVKIKFS